MAASRLKWTAAGHLPPHPGRPANSAGAHNPARLRVTQVQPTRSPAHQREAVPTRRHSLPQRNHGAAPRQQYKQQQPHKQQGHTMVDAAAPAVPPWPLTVLGTPLTPLCQNKQGSTPPHLVGIAATGGRRPTHALLYMQCSYHTCPQQTHSSC